MENTTLLFDHLRTRVMDHRTVDGIIDYLVAIHAGAMHNEPARIMLSHKNYWDLKYKYQYLDVVCSPQAKGKILHFVEVSSKRNMCFVHGDLNVRNILVRPDQTPIMIDYEETGFNDPAYDLGILLGNLILYNHMNGHVSDKQIRRIFTEYVKRMKMKNKADLQKSIVTHSACIILSRLVGKIVYKFLPEDIKPKLRELAEHAILNDVTQIEHFLYHS
jgi:thiamine kinase-like enzyme